MKKKKIIWIIILIIGILPFIIPLVKGIYDSINGFRGLCFLKCNYEYGLEALLGSIVLYSYVFWPTYIIGTILIILSIIKLKHIKNKRR